jgi:predicted metal-dependent HD superfamily phosphohydrolase
MDSEETFYSLAKKYTNDERKIHAYWNELRAAYESKGRHYHTFAHLENLLSELHEVRTQVKNWDVILFMIFYHDVVYSATRRDNEEESAKLAVERLKAMGVQPDVIELVREGIIATKTHNTHANGDVNYFTDADLAILGAEPGEYSKYTEQIRSEYKIFPDLLYKPGRRKVVEHFLAMPRIYKTSFFYEKYEQTARRNLSDELLRLK